MSKYHNQKVLANGHLFDSKKERDYYLLCLLPQLQRGEIIDIKFQPRYELQPAFTKNGKKYRPITYIADFLVIRRNGDVEVIDVKGAETQVFKLKRKLFEYKFPKLTLKVVKRWEGHEWQK